MCSSSRFNNAIFQLLYTHCMREDYSFANFNFDYCLLHARYSNIIEPMSMFRFTSSHSVYFPFICRFTCTSDFNGIRSSSFVHRLTCIMLIANVAWPIRMLPSMHRVYNIHNNTCSFHRNTCLVSLYISSCIMINTYLPGIIASHSRYTLRMTRDLSSCAFVFLLSSIKSSVSFDIRFFSQNPCRDKCSLAAFAVVIFISSHSSFGIISSTTGISSR